MFDACAEVDTSISPKFDIESLRALAEVQSWTCVLEAAPREREDDLA